jgi:hypothetical protein
MWGNVALSGCIVAPLSKWNTAKTPPPYVRNQKDFSNTWDDKMVTSVHITLSWPSTDNSHQYVLLTVVDYQPAHICTSSGSCLVLILRTVEQLQCISSAIYSYTSVLRWHCIMIAIHLFCWVYRINPYSEVTTFRSHILFPNDFWLLNTYLGSTVQIFAKIMFSFLASIIMTNESKRCSFQLS